MSRIGKKPIDIPAGVKVAVEAGVVNVEGKAKLSINLPPLVSVDIAENVIHVRQNEDTHRSSAMQGLARSLINNMVIGVTKGFRKDLQIVGVGYRAQISGTKLTLNIGYSHPVVYQVPEGAKVSVNDQGVIVVEGADKQLVGAVAAAIRRFREPEPYKGKGIRYVGEKITLKEGKSVG
ncbi:MAG: 50S ribosomal protein L6 [Victivallaceae bacterium]|nr:50S ribosomal protein L6 [Victivallaceae bacterium]